MGKLLDYAEHEFNLAKSDQSGISVKDHLKQVYKSTGIIPEDLKGKELPKSVEYLWSSFLSISTGRQMGYSGPLPITFSEIFAWTKLTGNKLLPIELEVIKRLDNLYVRTMNG